MANKVKVYGKAQNRTALGIVHAYLIMYPHATLEDLRKAFPASLCPDAGIKVKEILVPLAEAEDINGSANMSLFFAKEDEVLELADGQKVALAQIWSKPSFEKIVAQGEIYDITVAEFEKTMKGERGGYRLEYLNGYVPPLPELPSQKKKFPWWLWLLLALIAAGVIAAILLPRNEKVVTEVVVEQVVVRDTVYVQQIEDIETAFNAAQFAKNSAELNDDAKLALHDLAKVMKQNPELRLSITGHTSSEGDAEANQKLSEERAQAAVDFLVNKEGIEADRLTAVGKGSSDPKDPANPTSEVNRRTEFEIL